MQLLDKVIAILSSKDKNGWVAKLATNSAIKLNNKNEIVLEMGFVAPLWLAELKARATPLLTQLLGNDTWHVSQQIATLAYPSQVAPIKGVKNIIAVASGKGGVGKSTTTVNLALALAVNGAKVGVLDADVYGPSIPLMLGQEGKKPDSLDGKTMEPISAYGLVANSIGFLVEPDDAMVWRGPMASKALAQILNETHWPDLDYLVVDMPPGTGDIQLTMSQQVPLTASVIVTTPQDVALVDAVKGIEMFHKVNVPVVGLIENMSMHICSGCGHEEYLFGQGGGARIADKYQLPLLGQLPLHIDLREDTDRGFPTVARDPTDELALPYLALAESVSGNLYQSINKVVDAINIKMV